MSIQTTLVEYSDGDTVLEAYMAWDAAEQQAVPGVLVSHAWRGRSEFEEGRANSLAELGYVGFALDVYGKGKLGSNPEENAALMQPFLDDRSLLQRRMALALDQLKAQKECDADQVAAIGFCFGGLSVLDLARTGAELGGIASFHGLLGAPDNIEGAAIKTKCLIMHGWDDPMAPPAQVEAIAAELTAANADWQIHAYGGTTHAFTNPEAADPEHGLNYSPVADHRSWDSMRMFLAEVFS